MIGCFKCCLRPDQSEDQQNESTIAAAKPSFPVFLPEVQILDSLNNKWISENIQPGSKVEVRQNDDDQPWSIEWKVADELTFPILWTFCIRNGDEKLYLTYDDTTDEVNMSSEDIKAMFFEIKLVTVDKYLFKASSTDKYLKSVGGCLALTSSITDATSGVFWKLQIVGVKESLAPIVQFAEEKSKKWISSPLKTKPGMSIPVENTPIMMLWRLERKDQDKFIILRNLVVTQRDKNTPVTYFPDGKLDLTLEENIPLESASVFVQLPDPNDFDKFQLQTDGDTDKRYVLTNADPNYLKLTTDSAFGVWWHFLFRGFHYGSNVYPTQLLEISK